MVHFKGMEPAGTTLILFRERVLLFGGLGNCDIEGTSFQVESSPCARIAVRYLPVRVVLL